MNERPSAQVTPVRVLLLAAGLVGAALTGGSIGIDRTAAVSDTLARTVEGAHKAAEYAATHVNPASQVAATAAAAAARVMPQIPQVPASREAALHLDYKLDSYYEQIRSKMRWKPVRYAGNRLETPDARSRILLSQAAARKAGLQEVGLNYRDVYGIINAETSWIPRMGASKDGTPNLGIAQFEPATAKAVGLRDPHDPVEAVHAMAEHLKEAAEWSSRRISGLKLSPEEHAMKLREGVSIYYNLSTKGRNKWNGTNTASLPVETRRHIANARRGAAEAAQLEAQLRELQQRMSGPRTMVAGSSN